MMPRKFTEIAIVLCALFWTQTSTAQESVTGEFLIDTNYLNLEAYEEDPEDLDEETTPVDSPSSTSPAPASGGDWGVVVPKIEPKGGKLCVDQCRADDFMEGEATRIFAGPSQFPPENFGAYAILAFKSNPVEGELSRYLMICEAYRTSIPDAAYVMLPEEQQLVTVWPVISDEAAEKINVQEEKEKCSFAVHNYGLRTALTAVRHARMISEELARDLAQKRGPFLLAWNPSSGKGHEDALILRMDLSSVDMPHQAKRRMEFWVQQIEMHPERWLDGWQQKTIREKVADMADIFGEEILAFFGPGIQ